MKWVSIAGSFEINEESVSFLGGASVGIDPATSAPPFGIIRSNITVDKGEVELEFKLQSADARVQLILPGVESELFVGLNLLGAPYGFAVFRNNTFEPKGGAGYGSTLPVGTWTKLKISVEGANVLLHVNDVFVASATYQTNRGQLSIYFAGNDRIDIRNISVNSRAPICFVVMQFTTEFDALYREVIKPVCEDFNYRVVRADEFYTSTMIVDDITRSLRESSLVIADITPDNPNVFYEVGYAHAIQTPTILLSDRTKVKLPFDVSGFRTIFYDNTIAGKSSVEEALKRHLTALGERGASGSMNQGQGR